MPTCAGIDAQSLAGKRALRENGVIATLIKHFRTLLQWLTDRIERTE